jgi:hypothetical protein
MRPRKCGHDADFLERGFRIDLAQLGRVLSNQRGSVLGKAQEPVPSSTITVENGLRIFSGSGPGIVHITTMGVCCRMASRINGGGGVEELPAFSASSSGV